METHRDYGPLNEALKAMKAITSHINERTREVENITKVVNVMSSLIGDEVAFFSLYNPFCSNDHRFFSNFLIVN